LRSFGRCLFVAALSLCLLAASTAPRSSAAAPFKTLRWTNPLFNAALDDSGRSYCADGPDTCKDLARIVIWGQSNAGGPARIVKDLFVQGRAGLVDSTQVDLVAPYLHWHFWAFAVDQGGHYSPCPSPVLYVAGSQVTGVELPSDLIVATPIWFDVRGRKVEAPRGSGVYFMAWRVRGVLQKPARKVIVVDGQMVPPVPLPRFGR